MPKTTTRSPAASRPQPLRSRDGQLTVKLFEKGVECEAGGPMNSVLARPTVPRWVVAISVALSLCGVTGLVLTCGLGFETPNTALFAMSSVLTLAVPLAMLWHLAATRALTSAEKRIWLRELTGTEAWSAMSEYMSSPDLSASAQTRAENAAARLAVRNHA